MPFDALGAVTAKSPKSLMRMFGPKGNPQARNIFKIIAHLQKKEGIQFKVQAAMDKEDCGSIAALYILVNWIIDI